MEIAPATHLGAVELSVSDLDRSLDYWRRAIGLRLLGREDGTASLGADRELIRFVESRGPGPPTGSPASTTSRCSCRTGRASRVGSRTLRGKRPS